jgi:alkylated DNA repair dioxygenase AlkB
MITLKMDLFDSIEVLPRNLLQQDGVVDYYGVVIPQAKSNNYFDSLFNTIVWKNDEAIIFGKRIVTKRKVAWYGDRPFEYTYSNMTKLALPWTQPLKELKTLVEQETAETYNSCLLNLYHDGSEGMTWHSDNEDDLKKHGAIASLTLGAERKFSLKHKKTKKTVSLFLENGSLLVMKGPTQCYWLHSLPKTKIVNEPRINLTFRTIVEN